jgi:hypothetical protein
MTPSSLTIGKMHGVDVLFDPSCRWKLKPGQQVASAADVAGLAEERLYTIDSLGCRSTPGAAPDPAKPCVVFLGCGCTFGSGLNYEATLPFLCEPDGSPWQCINAGVPGYGLFQCQAWLLELAGKLPPIAAVVLHLPGFYRYPWIRFEGLDGHSYDFHSWEGLASVFAGMRTEDPARFERLVQPVLTDSIAIVDAMASSVPLLAMSHELFGDRWEQETLASSKATVLSAAIKAKLTQPVDVYRSTLQDWHPSQAYNEAVAAVVMPELERIIRAKS